jgi:hypothetical protein
VEKKFRERFKKFFEKELKTGIKKLEIQKHGDDIKISFFVGEKIKSSNLMSLIKDYVISEMKLSPIDDGDFCSSEGMGCLEFEGDDSTTVAFFTNHSSRSGIVIIGVNKYPNK